MIDLKNVAGFGVAGNFADHLEQAGESADFVGVVVDEENAPKGIFPFYLKGFEGFLSTFPLSFDTQKISPDEKVQMEPEMAILCEVTYTDSKVSALKPTHFTAYNDCSIRRPGAKKISEKKNWGAQTKGVSQDFIAIDHFSSGGILDHYRIASFIKREGTLIAYGQDSEALGYSYFYEKLIDWMVGKFSTQTDYGPLEDLASYLASINYPKQFLISIGATRYTDFGEHNFLEAGDDIYVVIYDMRKESPESVIEKLSADEALDASSSVLHQKVKG